jgi:hypothetical protein
VHFWNSKYLLYILPFPGRGSCVFDKELESGVCVCNEDWVGDRCNFPCQNGTNHGDGICKCHRTCDTGLFCFYIVIVCLLI